MLWFLNNNLFSQGDIEIYFGDKPSRNLQMQILQPLNWQKALELEGNISTYVQKWRWLAF